MTVEEALKVLDQVCAIHQGVRADHIAMQQAMQVVTEATKRDDTPKVAKKKEPNGNK